jgi:hypothetical protein
MPDMSQPKSDLERVFAHIEENREGFIERVMDYVRHPSISAQNNGIKEVAVILVDMLQGMGMEP